MAALGEFVASFPKSPSVKSGQVLQSVDVVCDAIQTIGNNEVPAGVSNADIPKLLGSATKYIEGVLDSSNLLTDNEIHHVSEKLLELSSVLIWGILNDCFLLSDLLVTIFDREKVSKRKSFEIERIQGEVCEGDFFELLRQKCEEGGHFEHFDAYFAIERRENLAISVLESFNAAVGRSNPEKENPKVLTRVFEAARKLLQSRPDIFDESLKMYLDYALKTLDAPMLQTQFFGVEMIRLLQDSPIFAVWASERRPLPAILLSSGHDSVIKDLQPCVRTIAANSHISVQEFLEIADRLLEEATSSEKSVKFLLIAEALTSCDVSTLDIFFSSFLKRELTEAGVRFIGTCLSRVSASVRLALSKLVGALDTPMRECVSAVILEVIDSRPEVLKIVFLLLVHFLKRVPDSVTGIRLANDVISRMDSSAAEENLKRVLVHWTPNEWFYEVMFRLVMRLHIPLTMETVSAILDVLPNDPARLFEVMEKLFAKAGVRLCYVDSFGDIMTAALSLEANIPVSGIRAVTAMLTRLFPSGCGSADAYTFFERYVELFLLDFAGLFGCHEGGANDDLLFNSFMSLFRSAARNQDKVINILCQNMKEPYETVEPKWIRFFSRFVEEYESNIPDRWLQIVRQKPFGKKPGSFQITIRANGYSIKMNVLSTTLVSDMVDALSLKMARVKYLRLYHTSYNDMPNSKTLKQCGIKANDIVNVYMPDSTPRRVVVLPSLYIAQRPELHNALFHLLAERDDPYLWKLMLRLPTLDYVSYSVTNGHDAVDFLRSCASKYQRMYTYQVILKKWDDSQSEGLDELCPYLMEKLREGEINSDIVDIMTRQEYMSFADVDEKIIKTLAVDGFMTLQGTDVRESLLKLFIRIMDEAPSTQNLFLELDGFLEKVFFSNLPNTATFLKRFADRRKLFERLILLFDQVSTSDNFATADVYYRLLADITDARCDPKAIFERISKISFVNQPSSIYDLLDKCLTELSDVSLEAKTLTDNLLETALYGMESLNQSTIYHLLERVFLLCPEAPARLQTVLHPLKEFRTQHWAYAPEKEMVRCHYSGLRNLGATCYMNSILQQLFFNGRFREAVVTSESENRHVRTLRDLFLRMALGEGSYTDTRNFATVWGEEDHVQFNPRMQEDALEFMQRLLERLPGDISEPYHGTSKVIFEGLEKPFRREIIEPFYCLEIPVANKASFDESIMTLKEATLFTKNNQYHDERLGNLDVKRYSVIQKLPNLLTIQLKRFDYNLRTGNRIKIQDAFQFPASFDASTYFDGHSGRYELCGVVTHTGSAEGGHYLSLIWGYDRWYKFDDENVESLSQEEFEQLGNGREQWASCAYLLLYRRVEDGGSVPDGEVTAVSTTSTEKPPSTTTVSNLPSPYIETSIESIQESMKRIVSKEDIELITQENKTTRFERSVFTLETADFVLKYADYELTWHYFLRIWCHSIMSEMGSEFVSHLIKDVPGSDAINDLVSSSRDIVSDIVVSAGEPVLLSLLSIMQTWVPQMSFETLKLLMTSVCNDALRTVSQFSILGRVGTFLALCSDGAESISDAIAPLIAKIVKGFFDSNPSQISLSSVDFTVYLKILTDASVLPDEFHEFFKLKVKDFAQTSTASDSVYCLAEKHVPAVLSLVPISKDALIRKLQAVKSTEEIWSLWNYEAFPEALFSAVSTCRTILLTHPTSTLCELITRPKASERQLGEQLFYRCFPSFPKTKISHVEDFGDSNPVTLDEVFMQSQPPDEDDDEALELLNTCIEYLLENVESRSQRLMGLIRVIIWLRCCLGQNDLSVFGDLILKVDQRNLACDDDLCQLLVLLATVDFEAVVELFCGNFSELMNIIRTDTKDIARRLVYFTNAFKHEASIMILLEADEFKQTIKKVIENDIGWPLSLIAKISGANLSILQESLKEDLELILKKSQVGHAYIENFVQTRENAHEVMETALLKGFNDLLADDLARLIRRHTVGLTPKLVENAPTLAWQCLSERKPLFISMAARSPEHTEKIFGQIVECILVTEAWSGYLQALVKMVFSSVKNTEIQIRVMCNILERFAREDCTPACCSQAAEVFEIHGNLFSDKILSSPEAFRFCRHAMEPGCSLADLERFLRRCVSFFSVNEVEELFEGVVRPAILSSTQKRSLEGCQLLVMFALERYVEVESILSRNPLGPRIRAYILNAMPTFWSVLAPLLR